MIHYSYILPCLIFDALDTGLAIINLGIPSFPFWSLRLQSGNKFHNWDLHFIFDIPDEPHVMYGNAVWFSRFV